MRAEVDQAKEGLRELGSAIASFYKSLISEGLSEDQALRLTDTYLVQMMQGAAASQMVSGFEDLLRDLKGGSEE